MITHEGNFFETKEKHRGRMPKGEDNDWEDIPPTSSDAPSTLPVNSSENQTPPRPASSSPRKRKVGQKATTRTVYIATNGALPRKSAPRPKASRTASVTPPQLVTREEMHSALTHSTRSTAKYIFDVIGSFFSLLKKPLTVLLVVWAIAIILNALSASFRRAFQPLCIIPGISSSPLCTWSTTSSRGDGQPQHAEYPRMIEIQSKTFEQLLDESVGSSSLALDIKKAEMATSDLVTVVRISDLRSKDQLANALSGFSDNARETARGLQKLNAKISGSVDNILAISDHALQTIGSSDSNQSSLMKIIWPFSSNGPDKELLAATFTQSLSVLSASLERLILSAEASLVSLNNLEEQLNTIYGIVSREDSTMSVANAELLATLWTRLGGNRAKVSRYAGNLHLLKELGNYRAQALARVVAALQALQDLSANMEELRERASLPELAGDEIPVEVHVRSLRSGVERLNEGRLRAKLLEEDALNRITMGLESA